MPQPRRPASTGRVKRAPAAAAPSARASKAKPAALPKSSQGTAPPATPPIYSEDTYCLRNSVGYLMKRLVSSMSNRVEQTLQAQSQSLTNSQWAPLMMIHQGQVNTICQLAREFHTDVGAMTRMVDRLESKGLCQRERSTTDRRVVVIRLTPAGEAAIGHVPPVIVQVLNDYLAGFTHAEWRTLIDLLNRMHANGLALTQQAAPPAGATKPQ